MLLIERYTLSGQDSVGNSMLSDVNNVLRLVHWLADLKNETGSMPFFCNNKSNFLVLIA